MDAMTMMTEAERKKYNEELEAKTRALFRSIDRMKDSYNPDKYESVNDRQAYNNVFAGSLVDRCASFVEFHDAHYQKALGEDLKTVKIIKGIMQDMKAKE